jgi:hypothetical protein
MALYFPAVSTKPSNVNSDPADQPKLPTAPPPVVTAPPPMLSEPLPKTAGGPSSGRKLLANLLSFFLALFLASGLASVVDDTCVLLLGSHLFTAISGMVSGLTLLVVILVYGLMGLTPLIPKRIVLPVVCLIAAACFATLPTAIYAYRWILRADLIAACLTVALSLGLLRWLHAGWKFRWPLVADRHLGTRSFSWWNLVAFVLLNLFVVLPATVAYVGGCASLAVSHFTDGFVALRPGGVVLQARKYVRDDGRTIVLFPMSHIAESDFYRSVEQSVTSNSVVLLEGVKDSQNLLTNHISYQRAAKALHLAEQHEDFDPKQGRLVPADVDVQEFTSNTIAVLNLVTLVHSQGLNAHTLSLLLQFSPSEEVEQQLLEDLLLKRNRHLLQELFARLPEADSFIIPWGAAHMAGLAKEIQKSGFHLVGTRDFVSIRFGGKAGSGGGGGWTPHAENSH